MLMVCNFNNHHWDKPNVSYRVKGIYVEKGELAEPEIETDDTVQLSDR